MKRFDFLATNHSLTKRDYVGRVVEHDKAVCAETALLWSKDYWDGDRRYGYGGYKYDGRWRAIAEEMAAQYDLEAGHRILDVGCGKGYLLYEFTQVVPGISVVGIDISNYGIAAAKAEIKDYLHVGDCAELPFYNKEFDLVYSLNTYHNLSIARLDQAVREMIRVAKKNKYICVESYRDQREKVNLLYWQLTCHTFFSPDDWEWFLARCGYDGDIGYIFFE